jgi:hypothetical protein
MDFGDADTSALSEESLARVAAMTRLRRERFAAEEARWAQREAEQAESGRANVELTSGLADDEAEERAGVAAGERRARERLAGQQRDGSSGHGEDMERHRRVQELEANRDRRVRQLRSELEKERFRAYWAEHRTAKHWEQQPEYQHRRKHDGKLGGATAVLRKAYEHSAPPFATDPAELARRGVTAAPELQERTMGRLVGASGDDAAAALIQSRLQLPPYHQFAAGMRERYAADVAQRQQQPQQQQPRPAGAASPGGRSGALSASPGRRVVEGSPFATYAATMVYDAPQ